MATKYSAMPVAGTEFDSNSRTGGSVPARFDAFLYQPVDETAQLKLTIKLRIQLRQTPPRLIPLQKDANGKAFWTKPWTGLDWQNFVGGATFQANLWNNRFWLIPPPSFNDFDRTFATFPGQVWRPNIRCELEVDFNATNDVHRSIDVANIDTRMLTGRTAGPGTFRSHALLYDSLDIVPWISPYGPTHSSRHYVVAHEIGHAIGLGHIGALLKTPLCEYAQTLDDMGLDRIDPRTKGGRNSQYCYGHSQGSAVAGNIMGVGDQFTVENAAPWVWAMYGIRSRPWEQWKVVTTDPGAGSWSPK